MTKLWLDGRFTVTGGKSKINLHNPIALHEFIADYLAANPSVNAASLADTLTIGAITDGTDIEISTGDVIKAVAGGGTLNLRAGADDSVLISTDAGVGSESFVNLTNIETSYGFLNNYFYANATEMYYISGATNPFAWFSSTANGLRVIADIASSSYSIAIADNTLTPITYQCIDAAVTINSGTSTNPTVVDAGVSNSVGLGGEGMNIKTGNTAYANQLALNANGSTFEGLVDTAALSADRNYKFPNASGSIGLVRYVAVNTPTVHTATTGEVVAVTTGAGALVVNLPSAAITNQMITIKKADNGAGAVTITAAGGQTIDGAATLSLAAQWNSATLVSNGGTAWYIIATV